MHFDIHMVFFKLVLKLTPRKPDNNFEAAQRKIRRVKNTHRKISEKYTTHTSMRCLQKGIFGFSILKMVKKKLGWTHMCIK